MQLLTLSIKFTATPETKDEFKRVITDLFDVISTQPNFVNTTLHEGLEKPEEFLVYETWNYSIEDFLSIQMKKPEVVAFEKTLAELGVTREPAVYTPFAYFGTPGK
jgi:quinol monooxygenase YgiN